MPHVLYFCFQSPNSRSEPLNMIYMLKCVWRPDFIFFGYFLLFFKIGTKPLFLDCPKTVILYLYKKIVKNFQKIQNLVSKHI